MYVATLTVLALLPFVLGGVIARWKGDYFSRGVAITLLAGVPGIVVLALCRRSKAREGDEVDEHGWPPYGALAFWINWLPLILLRSL
jgi:hypothetical protein